MCNVSVLVVVKMMKFTLMCICAHKCDQHSTEKKYILNLTDNSSGKHYLKFLKECYDSKNKDLHTAISDVHSRPGFDFSRF